MPKKLVLSLIVLVLLLVGGYFAYTYYTSSLTAYDATEYQDAVNVTSKDIMDGAWDRYSGPLKSNKDGKDLYLLGLGLTLFPQSKPWDFKTSPFWATVQAVSEDGNIAKLRFISPSSLPLVGQERDVVFEGCSTDNSFLAEEASQTAKPSDFYKEVGFGDDVISYCLNEECSVAGRLCKIIRL